MKMWKLLGIVAALVLTGCATATVEFSNQPQVSPQAALYFAKMLEAHERTGVEQGACVNEWTLRMRKGVEQVTIERVVKPTKVASAGVLHVTFNCYETDGSVHTHSAPAVCEPSPLDRVGEEVFGVLICPGRPFIVYAVAKPTNGQ